MATSQQSTKAARQDRDVHGKTQGDPLEATVRKVAGSRPEDMSQTGRIAQEDATTQSPAWLSQSSDDDQPEDGRFSIAEEQNVDQQSDQARRVGQMPEQGGNTQ
jgi:hypothetical protein